MAERDLPLKHVVQTGQKRIRTVDSVVLGWESHIVESLVKVFLILFLVVFIFSLLFNPDSSLGFLFKMRFHNFLLVFFFTGVVALIAGIVLSQQKSEKDHELKIIESTENGIRVGAGKFDHDKSFFLSWNIVNAVEAVVEKSTKNHYLVISTLNRKVYEFKWDNAFSWVDEESFFSNVKSSASHAKFNWDIDEVKAKDKLDSRYTNLWLHYFSAPTNRIRKGQLEVGVQLQDGLYEIVNKLGGGGQGMAYLARRDASAYSTSNSARQATKQAIAPHTPDELVNVDALHNSNEIFNSGVITDSGESLVVLKEYILPVYRGNNIESKKYNRLSGEAKILSSLSHEQVVKLYDCFIEDHRGYMVLEYISGKSLSELVKEEGPFNQIDVAKIGLSVLNILDYIHGQPTPIIHRDLSPDNLMMTDEGMVKLLDFTVAQESDIQRTATVVGKQSYISPEQFRGSPVIQSDIYSFGCTMFFLLTGCDPKPMELESIRESNPSLDEDLDFIIQKSAAFKLSDRYTRSSEMAEDLKYWLTNAQNS